MENSVFNDVTIEKIGRNDLKRLKQLFSSAFSDEVDVGHIKRRIRRARQFYYILRPLSNYSLWVKNLFNIYVFKIQDQIVGFIQVSYLNSVQLHIDYIAVASQYRGQGLGTKVLRKLLAKLADGETPYDVVLEVRTDNPAYHLYRRLGFWPQSQILHYERLLADAGGHTGSGDPTVAGFRRLRASDHYSIYRLHRASISAGLRRVIRREYSDFNPSMFTRHLERFKNYLMRTKKREYVVEENQSIIAALTIHSYPKSGSHVIHLIVHPHHEPLRGLLLQKALAILHNRYRRGAVNMTVYDDSHYKQKILENMGFLQREAYYLMLRPGNPAAEYTGAAQPVRPAAGNSANRHSHRTVRVEAPFGT